MKPVSTCLAATVTALATGGCGEDVSPRTTTRQSDQTLLTVDTAVVEVPLSFQAQLYVEHDAVVYARAAGIVESLYVDLGARVTRGQILAQLESVDQEIALAAAVEEERNAQRRFERQAGLASRGMVTEADSELAALDYQRAALNLRQARRDAELTRSPAPFSGRISSRYVKPRSLVSVGDSLFRVTAARPLRVAVNVPERLMGSIAVGSAASVISHDGSEASATVILASPAIDAASGTREFILQLARGSAMRPGASVNVQLGSQPHVAVVIPHEAITETGYVVVSENGRPQLRAIVTGAVLEGGFVEVISGLMPGEQLVVAGR